MAARRHSTHTPAARRACHSRLVAALHPKPTGDVPACVSPVLGSFAFRWTFLMPADARKALTPHLDGALGTAKEPRVETARAWLALDWLVRTCGARCASLGIGSRDLAALPELGPKTAARALRTVRDVRATVAKRLGDLRREQREMMSRPAFLKALVARQSLPARAPAKRIASLADAVQTSIMAASIGDSRAFEREVWAEEDEARTAKIPTGSAAVVGALLGALATLSEEALDLAMTADAPLAPVARELEAGALALFDRLAALGV